MKLATIVGHVGGRCKGESAEQDRWVDHPPRATEIKSAINDHVDEIFQFVDRANDNRHFDEVDQWKHQF